MFDTDARQRSADQARMHEFFLAACARNIYGSAYEMNQVDIMEYNRWATLTPYVCVSTPRRWGKSYGMAMLLAAYMNNVDDCTICIFSTGTRAGGSADGLLGYAARRAGSLTPHRHTRKFLEDVFGVTNFKVKNADHLVFVKPNGRKRTCKAFPAGNATYVFVTTIRVPRPPPCEDSSACSPRTRPRHCTRRASSGGPCVL